MSGKCEHGLTTRECLVCASPKYGASQPAPPLPAPQPCIAPACQCRYEDTPNGRIRFCELAGAR